MFYVVYDIASGLVNRIITDCSASALAEALPESLNFITVDQIPTYDEWRQNLVVREGVLTVENKELTPEQEQEITNIVSQQEITRLKFELKETDYYTLKYIEGALSEKVFKEKCVYRQALRDRIKELESKIVHPTV
jgi:hypothetical protein